ncbi:glycosyltransferase family 2 protein [Curtobacterium sp. 20TX0008]|uniref:glycosyltransferase family 2 protein n=1 Tax=Curtobacterium sp. 20TX0008 TaxID=3022018 RepID=UPI00232F3209|nr:glycosyltransferase family 2 protein [Curtobacterium sp. 20TX0008]MDB6427909.1 glycosyltransferase family 2 protein [Curtobacterium sp. 20TX0008]
MQTKNEAIGIEACLRALGDFDQVIVVDSRSTDETIDVARRMGAEVVEFDWNGRYPKKKQWQLDNVETRHDWILFLDADETPDEQLIESMRRAMNRPEEQRPAAYDLHLLYYFAQRPLRHGHRVQKRALVNRKGVRFPVIDDLNAPGMGELEGHYQPTAHGRVERLRGRLRHEDLDPVRTWFDRHNRYSDWEAHLAAAKSTAANRYRSRQGKAFAAVPFKPLLFFVYSYVARLGFLDGRAGFDYAFALAHYYWQIGLKTREQIGGRNRHA